MRTFPSIFLSFKLEVIEAWKDVALPVNSSYDVIAGGGNIP